MCLIWLKVAVFNIKVCIKNQGANPLNLLLTGEEMYRF